MILITEDMIESVRKFIGDDNVRWFAHVKGLKGSVNSVLRLNANKKFLPVHPIHLREGMQIRNHLRRHPDSKGWNDEDFDNAWVMIINHLIECFKQRK